MIAVVPINTWGFYLLTRSGTGRPRQHHNTAGTEGLADALSGRACHDSPAFRITCSYSLDRYLTLNCFLMCLQEKRRALGIADQGTIFYNLGTSMAMSVPTTRILQRCSSQRTNYGNSCFGDEYTSKRNVGVEFGDRS